MPAPKGWLFSHCQLLCFLGLDQTLCDMFWVLHPFRVISPEISSHLVARAHGFGLAMYLCILFGPYDPMHISTFDVNLVPLRNLDFQKNNETW
jgi:hypothetical protein